MSINVQPTPENKALAAAVEARMAADGRIVNARAVMLRSAGYGALVALIGVGIGAACFGFSYVLDAQSSATKIADALVAALDRTTLKTAGEVRVAEDARVKLENGTVLLDPSSMLRIDSTLKLDPEATVKLDRNARVSVALSDVPRPSAAQLRPEMATRSGGAAVTNYSVFKEVQVGQGQVVTGWSFTSSEQTSPSSQYCYYVQTVGDGDSNTQVKVDLARNGVMLANLKARAFDPATAAQSCIWFDGSATRAP